jgi:hypothetical protein
VRIQENCKTADFQLCKKGVERNFEGQKYLICIFYIDQRKFGASFRTENSDYWISPKCVSFPNQWLLIYVSTNKF